MGDKENKPEPKKRGRPFGSKNKSKAEIVEPAPVETVSTTIVVKPEEDNTSKCKRVIIKQYPKYLIPILNIKE